MSLEGLCKSAKRIDKVDAITGPLSVALYNSGSEVLYTAGVVVSAAELLLFKVPFVLSYISQTRDAVAPLFFLAKEIVANSNRISGVIDIVPFYTMVLSYKMSTS